ncbi:MAG: hypothetical protein Q7J55_04695 [bacterium]|nr:hypothetical protein [bacterium]
MTFIFLKAKMESFRFAKEMQQIMKDCNADQKIIDNPNFDDQDENELRQKLLQSFGGSDDEGNLFENFPKDVSWKRALLTKSDLKKVKYIDYDYWNELSNGTRLVSEGSSSIRKGVEIFRQSNQHFWNALDALKKGQKFPEPILVARNPDADFVVVDGHLRLTVYLLDPKYTPDEIEVVLGYSENFQNWDLY